MTFARIVDRPAFTIFGKKTWIDGPDSTQFGRFWQACRSSGFLDILWNMMDRAGQVAGPSTAGAFLGVSRVEKDPSNRSFYYMVAVEEPGDTQIEGGEDLERYEVPAARWAVFACHGKVPGSIVAAEMYAFGQWLPGSGYRHALAPEMEVYPAGAGDDYCEFWLPVTESA